MTAWDAVIKVLATFNTPPTVTDLRERLEQRDPTRDPEELRAIIFEMLSGGQLKLTAERRVYR